MELLLTEAGGLQCILNGHKALKEGQLLPHWQRSSLLKNGVHISLEGADSLRHLRLLRCPLGCPLDDASLLRQGLLHEIPILLRPHRLHELLQVNQTGVVHVQALEHGLNVLPRMAVRDAEVLQGLGKLIHAHSLAPGVVVVKLLEGSQAALLLKCVCQGLLQAGAVRPSQHIPLLHHPLRPLVKLDDAVAVQVVPQVHAREHRLVLGNAQVADHVHELDGGEGPILHSVVVIEQLPDHIDVLVVALHHRQEVLQLRTGSYNLLQQGGPLLLLQSFPDLLRVLHRHLEPPPGAHHGAHHGAIQLWVSGALGLTGACEGRKDGP
mmetsp:Transcript_96087/g.165683  ORF Transcript_96087/g.165683 Transcript_96087/m.165683 type:complete len:323 (+) Transcript_96087:1173-2141(+)